MKEKSAAKINLKLIVYENDILKKNTYFESKSERASFVIDKLKRKNIFIKDRK